MTANPAAVTGVGLLTSLGRGTSLNWQRLIAGESGVREISQFETRGLTTTIAATVELDLPPGSSVEQRAIAMGDLVIDEALQQAGIDGTKSFDGGFFVAPPVADLEYGRLVQMTGASSYASIFESVRDGMSSAVAHDLVIPLHYARRHQLDRLPLAVTTACASGASAIQCGVEAIRRGEYDRVIVLGVDSPVRAEMIMRFSLLSALSTANGIPSRASKPFSLDRDGFVMGEGAAALVLESVDAARRRGAEVLAYVMGCGEAGDNFHRTRSNPDGLPIVRCMQNALQDAGADVADVDYINAHGTSTPENDKMESQGIRALLGPRARAVPVSSVKSMIGHTLAAAGAVEAVCSVMTVATGMVPPTINQLQPDPEIGLDVVPNVARSCVVDFALSNSFGFGGQNVCIAFGTSR